LGNGNGTFGSEHIYVASSDVSGLVAGAFHGGSTLDLILNTASGLTVLNGKGDGTFQVGVSYSGQDSVNGAADINGDGKLDLVDALPGDLGSANPVVRLGNGDGTLQGPITVSNDKCVPAAVADFNGDTKPDIGCFVRFSRLLGSAVLLNATPPPG
jgi:hypothetical protein